MQRARKQRIIGQTTLGDSMSYRPVVYASIGRAVAVILLAAGCQGPQPQSATLGVKAAAPLTLVSVDLQALTAALHQRRSIAGLGFGDAARITQARLIAEGPGVSAGTQTTTPWQVSGGTAAAALSLPVAGGLNRLFTLQGLDANGHVIATLRGLGTVPQSGSMVVTLNVNTDAAGRVLADLLAGPGAGDSADTAGVLNSLATTDLTTPLGTYVAATTGYNVAANTYTGVNPLRLRDHLLANMLRSGGPAVLQAAPSAAMQQPAAATVTVSVTQNGVPFAGTNGQVTLADPVSTDAAFAAGGVTSFSNVPPGTWAVEARAAGLSAWGTVTALDQEATAAVTVALGASTATPAVGSGIITTYAGIGTTIVGTNGINIINAQGLALDPANNLYIAEDSNNRVRKLSPGLVLSAFAGTGVAGGLGDGGPATAAQLSNPTNVALDSAGNFYIAGFFNRGVRKVSATGVISTYAGSGVRGTLGDGGLATAAQFISPQGVAVDSAGTLYISDPDNNNVRKVTSAGIISAYASMGNYAGGFAGDGAAASNAQLNSPKGLAVDASGNLFIADTMNNRIRKVTTAGIISTYAGTGVLGSTGDGGQAASAQLNRPNAVAVDAAGNLYIADTYNQKIRKVTTGGVISTVAGTGVAGALGDGGAATSAQLNNPQGVAVDAAGSLYISDLSNGKIRKVF
jgi:sugar lactone lactonase YvrE